MKNFSKGKFNFFKAFPQLQTGRSSEQQGCQLQHAKQSYKHGDNFFAPED